MSHACHDHACHAEPAANASPAYRRVLWVALVLNAAMFGVEVTAGLAAGSVSLLADAVDFFGDAANYGLSLAVLGMGLAWRARAAAVKGLSMGAFGVFVLGSSFHDLWPEIFKLPTEGMAIACVLALVMTRSLEHKELYQCVNWSIVFLISGMLIVGAMLEHTGTAAMMAETMAQGLQGAPGWMVLCITYFAAMVLTELISNNAVAAMMTPVVIHLSHQLHLSPRPMIMAVIFAASASFSTPVGYQTNTFIYGAGGYRFADFFRVGIPLNLTLWIVATILIPYFWPL